MQTKIKRRAITKEFFDYAKSVLNGRTKESSDQATAKFLGCSAQTVGRIVKAKNFEDFKLRRNIRSEMAKLSKKPPKKIEKNIVAEWPTADPYKAQSLFDNVAGSELISAVTDLAVSITQQTKAIQENTEAYKRLRDRMAVANQLKARELHNLPKMNSTELKAYKEKKK